MGDAMTKLAVALVAHDDKKDDMAAWAQRHVGALTAFDLWATGTTGARVAEATGLPVQRLKSGPLGGDAQLGAMIAEGRLDALFFFTDPLSAMPHDVDVKSLLRLAVLYDIPTAMSPRTADFVLAGLCGPTNL
jgi:methylglyoxal synthase